MLCYQTLPQLLGRLGAERSQLCCPLGIRVSWRKLSFPKSCTFLGIASIQWLVSKGVSMQVKPSCLKSSQPWGAILLLRILMELIETFVVATMIWHHISWGWYWTLPTMEGTAFDSDSHINTFWRTWVCLPRPQPATLSAGLQSMWPTDMSPMQHHIKPKNPLYSKEVW